MFDWSICMGLIMFFLLMIKILLNEVNKQEKSNVLSSKYTFVVIISVEDCFCIFSLKVVVLISPTWDEMKSFLLQICQEAINQLCNGLCKIVLSSVWNSFIMRNENFQLKGSFCIQVTSKHTQNLNEEKPINKQRLGLHLRKA